MADQPANENGENPDEEVKEFSGKLGQWRAVTHNEDQLLNFRFSWLLLAQSFILAACISVDRYPSNICWLSLVICIVCYFPILAAMYALHKAHKKNQELSELITKHDLPGLTSTTIPHYMGCSAAMIIPLVFMYFWIARLPTDEQMNAQSPVTPVTRTTRRLAEIRIQAERLAGRVRALETVVERYGLEETAAPIGGER